MHEVTCPGCQNKRLVSKVQFWRLNKGLRRHCKSCAEAGNKKRLGKKQPESFKKLKRQQMIGNQYAKGLENSEHIAELAKINKGNKYAYGIRGAAHHSWKGGLGTERHRAMGQHEYKAWRAAVFAKDNYTCQMCESYGGYLHADHIKKWAEYPALRYDVNNGRTLCRACHYFITFKRKLKTTSKWGLTSQEN